MAPSHPKFARKPPDGDPLAAAGRAIALVVAGNQPLYPLYLHWFVGAGALAACGTWLSTPAFVASALLARRRGPAARLLLPLAGIANTVWSAKLLGVSVGLALFLVPCGVITLLIFRRAEWRLLAGVAVLAAAAMWLLPLAGAHPIAALNTSQRASIMRINGWSVAGLTVFACWTLGRVRLSEWRARRVHSQD